MSIAGNVLGDIRRVILKAIEAYQANPDTYPVKVDGKPTGERRTLKGLHIFRSRLKIGQGKTITLDALFDFTSKKGNSHQGMLFPGVSFAEAIDALKAEGAVITRWAKGGMRLYLPGQVEEDATNAEEVAAFFGPVVQGTPESVPTSSPVARKGKVRR